jgi:hypothetical protein
VDYAAANVRALELATEAVSQRAWTLDEFRELVAVVSSLNGDSDLAMFLFSTGGSELSCPSCGEAIKFDNP